MGQGENSHSNFREYQPPTVLVGIRAEACLKPPTSFMEIIWDLKDFICFFGGIQIF